MAKNTIFIYLYAILQSFAIFFWGAVYIWTWSILTIGVLLLCSLLWWKQLWYCKTGNSMPDEHSPKIFMEIRCQIPMVLGMIGAISVLGIFISQFYPHNYYPNIPHSLNQTIQEWNIPKQFPSTFSSFRQQLSMIQWIIPIGIFFIIPQILQTRNTTKIWIRLLVIMIACEAVYGILQMIFHQDCFPILNLPQKEQRIFCVNGSYMNYNTYACLLAVGFILCIGIITQISHEHQKIKDAHIFRWITISILILLSLFFSLSRGGFVCWLAGLIIFSILVYRGKIFHHLKRRIIIVLAMITVVFLLYCLLGGGKHLWQKWIEMPESISGRWLIWQGAWEAFLENPWLGCGAGNFRYAFIQYAPQEIGKSFGPLLYTHNDYFQFLIEYGIIGTTFLLAFLGVWFYYAVQVFIHRQSMYPRILHYAVWSALCALAIHGIWDFSWHIPSHSFLGISLMASLLLKRNPQEDI